jgi:hypothetical protein
VRRGAHGGFAGERAPAALSLFLSPRKRRSEGICAGRAGLTGSRGRRYVGIGPRRPNRSKQGTEWARAVRRLGVPVGMGGKANCLCLRGIWETPKPRYREETKPVERLPGTTFRAKDPARPRSRRGGVITRHGDCGAEGRARRLTCAERHERVSRGVSAPRCVFGPPFAAVPFATFATHYPCRRIANIDRR